MRLSPSLSIRQSWLQSSAGIVRRGGCSCSCRSRSRRKIGGFHPENEGKRLKKQDDCIVVEGDGLDSGVDVIVVII